MSCATTTTMSCASPTASDMVTAMSGMAAAMSFAFAAARKSCANGAGRKRQVGPCGHRC